MDTNVKLIAQLTNILQNVKLKKDTYLLNISTSPYDINLTIFRT